jgi:hypothetical protein
MHKNPIISGEASAKNVNDTSCVSGEKQGKQPKPALENFASQNLGY